MAWLGWRFYDVVLLFLEARTSSFAVKMSARDREEVEIADRIVENAVAAGDLVTNLLEFAKAGAHEHNAADLVSLGGTMRQIVRRFQPIAKKKGLYLRVRVTGDADVTTDRLELERVVANLVDNAIKVHG